MKREAILAVVGLVMLIIGLVLVGVFSNWLVVLGLVLVILANNVSQRLAIKDETTKLIFGNDWKLED